jgi:NAD(P)-dependent dehydrogenase (short-subunit alcohol dehydrogenase family)
MPAALVTGATRGLGRALATALATRHWNLVIDARDPAQLAEAADALRAAGSPQVRAVAGDIADDGHRTRLAAAVAETADTETGGLDLLVNNASTLGPSPQPRLADYPLNVLERVYAVNTLAPLALTQAVLPHLERAGGRVVNVTSDAAVEPYEGWGGYGSSKAALEQLTAILGAELPHLRVYAFDPGDMRTQMHQQAFPGEDISDRPLPETVVPSLLRLVGEQLPSGRFRAADLAAAVPA